MTLLDFVLSTTYFQVPMGSPLSVAVSDMYMEDIEERCTLYMEDLEERAMVTAQPEMKPKIWKR